MARKERGRVFCIHPGDAPRRRIASRDSHHECLTTLSLCRYGRFNFFAIMTGSLFPRGDKVAGKILCYAPMAPSTFPFPPRFLLLLLLPRGSMHDARVLETSALHSAIFSSRNPDIESDKSRDFEKNISFVLYTLFRILRRKSCRKLLFEK